MVARAEGLPQPSIPPQAHGKRCSDHRRGHPPCSDGPGRQVGLPVKRVLVVDDNLDVLELFARMLSVYDKTLGIATVSTGQEALAELRNRPPDLVFLDIVMPGMDGWQVLEHKGRDEAVKNIPVVIISAEDMAGQIGNSEVLLATMGRGLSVNQILHCSLQFSKLLLEPEQEPDPGLE